MILFRRIILDSAAWIEVLKSLSNSRAIVRRFKKAAEGRPGPTAYCRFIALSVVFSRLLIVTWQSVQRPLHEYRTFFRPHRMHPYKSK